MKTIVTIPINNTGDLLFLKDFREDKGQFFIKYKVSINEIPFQETPIYLVDGNTNFCITADNGTIMYRWNALLMKKFE